ncbi:TPA: replication factor C large subunit [Candidatus Woesearchaeota archaeon]|nr:replication factor C large subunit [Candidatus Woesearchaeota archaeon]
MTLYTLKYAPQNASQVFGQQKAVAQLQNFIMHYKTLPMRAAILHGPIGTGKTSSVYALATQLGYDVLELNSSDLRNADNIKSFLGSALGQQSLFFTPKIVLIDEIDNISGVKDRGCIPALIKAIQKSSFPVILTANDISDKKMKPIVKIAKKIEFHKLEYRSIAHCMQWICEQEGVPAEEKAINSLARQADGDMRAALLDLHICTALGKVEFKTVMQLSDRKRTDTILNALRLIFKSSSVENALPALRDVDVDMNHVFLWIDANLPREYSGPALARAYEWLSRADVFNGRIRKRQHWRFLAYVSNLLTAGISSAKDERNPEFIQYKQTMRLLRIWQANMKFAKRKEIAKKLAEATHTSTRRAVEQMPYLQSIFRNRGGSQIAEELELSDDEVAWLR